MDPKDSDITPAILLQHLQSMEQRLTHRIDAVRDELKGDIGGLSTRVDGILGKVERMERNITGQIQTIDERLDEIEIEHLPKRVAALELAAKR